MIVLVRKGKEGEERGKGNTKLSNLLKEGSKMYESLENTCKIP